jgi:hypothetical protein
LGLLQVGALNIIRKKYLKKRQEKGNRGKIIFKKHFFTLALFQFAFAKPVKVRRTKKVVENN